MLRATFPQRSAAVDGELTISSTMAMRSLLSAIAALSTPPYSRAAATACACSLQALQGLKPDYGGQLMPELKLRPPKEFAKERLANHARLPEHEICGDCEGHGSPLLVTRCRGEEAAGLGYSSQDNESRPRTKPTSCANEKIDRSGYGVCESTVTRGRPLAPSSTESCA